MPFMDKIKNGTPTLSFELFPPKNINGWATFIVASHEHGPMRLPDPPPVPPELEK